MPPGAAPGAPDDAGDGYDYAAQLEREPATAKMRALLGVLMGSGNVLEPLVKTSWA